MGKYTTEKAIVYFIKCENVVKIGYTILSYSEKRISNIRADSISTIPSVVFVKLFSKAVDANAYEFSLHGVFDHYKISGEKFLWNKEIEDFLSQNKMSHEEIQIMNKLNNPLPVNKSKVLSSPPGSHTFFNTKTNTWEFRQNSSVDESDRHYVRVVKIEPSWAKEVLENRNAKNRPKKRTNVNLIITDIVNNKFKDSPDIIAFDAGGNLANGQHRLTAVVQSNTPIDCLVGFNFSDDSFAVTDKGSKRSDIDTVLTTGRTLSKRAVAALNYGFFTLRSKQGSSSEKQELWDNYGEIAEKYVGILTNSICNYNSVHSAFVKAHIFYDKNGEDTKFLEEVASILNSGASSTDMERIIFNAREKLIQDGSKRVAGRASKHVGTGIKEAYLTVCTAILKYKDKNTSAFRKIQSDPFDVSLDASAK